MISLLTLFTEPSKLCKELYVLNTEMADAGSYIFCSLADPANETELISEIQKKFYIQPFIVSDDQVAKKEQELRDFLKNKYDKYNGILIIYPIEDKLHVLVYGNLGMFHFRNNLLEKKITGSFHKSDRGCIKIETDDVLTIVRNEAIKDEFFDSLYQSQQYPMLFVDIVGEKTAILENMPQFKERIDRITPNRETSVRTSTGKIRYQEVIYEKEDPTNTVERVKKVEDSDVIMVEILDDDPDVFIGEIVDDDERMENKEVYEEARKKLSFFKRPQKSGKGLMQLFSRMKYKLIYNESMREKLVGILLFLVGFFIVLLIMFLLKLI